MNQPASFFKRHIFFCTNQRDNGEDCCANHHAAQAFDHCKKITKEMGLVDQAGVRVSKSGCLGRCELGPTAVVYPEATWYTFVDLSDIDEIVETHLKNGKIVERLRLE